LSNYKNSILKERQQYFILVHLSKVKQELHFLAGYMAAQLF